MSDGIVVRAADLAEIIVLRHDELRPGRPRATAEFDGDAHPRTRHFGVFAADGAVLGCVSFMDAPYESTPAWQLRGMATRADMLRRGVGSRLIGHALPALAAELGARPIWCNARCSAVGFYQRQGLRVVSPEFDVPDIGPHVVMWRPA